MKRCPHCGKELPQEMQFCPYCMEKLITEAVVGDTPTRRRRRWLWIVIVILLLLLLCGLWLWRPWQHPTAKKDTASPLGGSAATTTTTSASTAKTGTTTTADTTTTTQNTSGTDTTAPSTGISTTDTGTTGSTSTSTSTSSSAAPCAAGHDWQAVTETVHIEETGHYKTESVEKQVTLFRCALCYEEFGVLTDYYAHFDEQHDGDSLQGIFRDRYETVTEYREVEESVWVVDTPAYDKTITVGRQCAVCGKTETNQDKE